MLPSSLLAIGSMVVGRPPRSHLHARAPVPCCCIAPTRPAVPPEDHPRSGGAGRGRVQLARVPPTRGRGGGRSRGAPRSEPRRTSSSARSKIIALFRGAQEAIGRGDLPKARVLLRHCLEIDQVAPLSSKPEPRAHPSAQPSALSPSRSTRAPPAHVRVHPQPSARPRPRPTRTRGSRWRAWRRARATRRWRGSSSCAGDARAQATCT